MHERKTHPEPYHTKEALPNIKHHGWSDEERLLLAKSEIKNEGAKFINQTLQAIPPFKHRTLESIKCERKKAEYRSILVGLREDKLKSEGPNHEEICLDNSSETNTDI